MKKILRRIMIIAILCIIFYMISGIYQETKIRKSNTTQKNILTIQENNKANKLEEEKIQQRNVVTTKYKGYKVIANLKIDKLNIDTCVLDKYTKEAMEICITKFFGPNPNEVGNFCITGHNYITKNMFGYLYKLNTGDTFTLTDNHYGTVEYEIYDKYRAKENQTQRTITKNRRKKRGNISYLL